MPAQVAAHLRIALDGVLGLKGLQLAMGHKDIATTSKYLHFLGGDGIKEKVDEPRMLELLREGLYEHGFTVMTAVDGEAGLEMVTAHELDAVVLDIGLPKLDGYALMQALRERARLTPVLMLTARDTEDDIIRGLDVGADDYLTKPFSFPELVARLQSITRQSCAAEDDAIRVGDLVLGATRQSVTRDGKSVDLTRLEFLLLTCLARFASKCVSKQTLTEFVWGKDHPVGQTALEVLVNSLRAKIDGPFHLKLIVTVRGSGYRLQCGAPERES